MQVISLYKSHQRKQNTINYENAMKMSTVINLEIPYNTVKPNLKGSAVLLYGSEIVSFKKR